MSFNNHKTTSISLEKTLEEMDKPYHLPVVNRKGFLLDSVKIHGYPIIKLRDGIVKLYVSKKEFDELQRAGEELGVRFFLFYILDDNKVSLTFGGNIE